MEGLDVCRKMLSFIGESPSCFHVIANLKDWLAAAGFQELDEREEWRVCAGGSYYVTRNESSLIAFRIPEGEARGFHMAASHSDSPAFKLKEAPEMESEKRYVRLNTEKYGGMILSTWLDRPLSVAGRVTVCADIAQDGESEQDERTGLRSGRTDNRQTIVTKLVNLDTDLCVIPNVAIHMNRDINKGIEYNPQTDMLPLYGECGSGDAQGMLGEQIAEAAGVDPEEILGQDLFLYVRDKGRLFGREGEFVLSPRLDDLQCVYASMQGFLSVIPKEYIALCAVFDNEEVGSGTRQGADSTFLEDVVTRVCNDLAGQAGESVGTCLKSRMIADSFLISADNAHAVHPNHPELADPTNRPCLNGGIVIKYHGSQKYTTDAVSAAYIKSLCRRAGVPFQTYANRSDIAGGSTLGNISAAHVSVNSADIGLPQLAMHSAVETGGVRDTAYALRMFQEFFSE